MPVIVARGITKRKPAMRVRSRREAMPDNLVILDRCKSRLWALQDILSTERSRHDTDVARVGSWCAELHGVAVRRGQVAGGERQGVSSTGGLDIAYGLEENLSSRSVRDR